MACNFSTFHFRLAKGMEESRWKGQEILTADLTTAFPQIQATLNLFLVHRIILFCHLAEQ